MKTINQILKPSDSRLGHWLLWTNSVIGKLDKLRVEPRYKIPVQFEAVEYKSNNGYDWECQHVDRHSELEESIDYQKEAGTGITQGAHYTVYLVCDACGATYNIQAEEWSNDN